MNIRQCFIRVVEYVVVSLLISWPFFYYLIFMMEP